MNYRGRYVSMVRRCWANSNSESLDEYDLECSTRSSRSAREHDLCAHVSAHLMTSRFCLTSSQEKTDNTLKSQGVLPQHHMAAIEYCEPCLGDLLPQRDLV